MISCKKTAERFFLGILLLLLVTLSGCQQKQVSDKPILTEKQISTVESLYNQELTAVYKGLHLEETAVSPETAPGLWSVKKPALFDGREFSEDLLFDVSTETFYGIRYTARFEDAEELSGLALDLLEKANDVYGKPSTYPELQNRLTSETFSSDLSESMTNGDMSDWKEEWTVGKQTCCTLSVMVVEAKNAALSIEYRLIP